MVRKMKYSVGKMYQLIASYLPIFCEQSERALIGIVKKNDIVVFLTLSEMRIKVLTSDGLVGFVPHIPERHWVEYEG